MLQPVDGGYLAIAGPDAICVRTLVGLSRSRLGLESELTVDEGQRVPFLLSQFPSHEAPPAPGDAFAALDLTEKSWQEWTSRSTYAGDYADRSSARC